MCAAAVWRRDHAAATPSGVAAPDRAAASPVSGRQRARWIALAFIPSSLMLAVTTYLSTDIAAVPLLWIVPLALYLVTFVVAFGAHGESARRMAARMFPLLVVPLILIMSAGATNALLLVFPLHLLTFVAAAMYCHGELAASRPERTHLTEFYLWMSFGGMLGGMFNALVAPVMFRTVVEYPLALVAACAVLPAARAASWRTIAVAIPAVVGVLTFIAMRAFGQAANVQLLLAALTVPALIACGQRRHPVRFAASAGALLAVALAIGTTGDRLLHAERTFFGVYRVSADADGRSRQLWHGTTLHGVWAVRGALEGEPLTYFHRTGPFGQADASLPAAARARVGVIGLGVGTLAAYARPWQQWTFFEIDPAVERIARTSAYFGFLDRCGGRCRVVIGDARLSLRRAASPPFDLIVLDAFSSDAIPMHLLTSEAVSLYLSRLAPGGALVFHVSNRHLSLEPIVARLAAAHGLVAVGNFDRWQSGWPAGRAESHWIAIARTRGDLGRLAEDERWKPLSASAATPLWTDDFSNILSALNPR
jgi:spermidine synthase